MTSTVSSPEECRYNILNRLVRKAAEDMKCKYIPGVFRNYEYDEAVELNNALVNARAVAEQQLKKDKTRFVFFGSGISAP